MYQTTDKSIEISELFIVLGIDLVSLPSLCQRLMKHTEAEHGDLSLLRRAEREIHEFALKIDAIQKETNEQASVTELVSRKELDSV